MQKNKHTQEIFIINEINIIFNHVIVLLKHYTYERMFTYYLDMGKKPDISSDLKKRILSRHLQGKSLREISELLTVSVGAVRNTIKVSHK